MEKGFTKDLVAKIKAALAFSAIELPVKEVVQLEDVTLMDGTILSVDKMEVGSNAMFTGADGVAVPANGEYEYADGSIVCAIDPVDGLGKIIEIKTKEVAADPVVEPVSEMAAILSRLEALEKTQAASTMTLEAQLSETKKHLGTALEAVNKINETAVAINLESQTKQSPKKSLEELDALERYRAIKSNMK